jgi:predicted RNA-binding protein (virulence factor B family)
MIEIGKYNTLPILRDTSVGLYLGDEINDVLLPNKYVPSQFKIGDSIKVFVYLDQEERPVATTLRPYITLNDYAFLKVNHVNKFGAFLDWGLEKDLFVPFKEQARPMEEGKRYFVHLYMDEKTNRLVGASKTNQFLDNKELTVQPHEQVDLIIMSSSDLGVNVIINGKHKGLLYNDTLYENLRPGDKMKGYIKAIRPDNKIDVLLEEPGYNKIEPNSQKILDEMRANRGFLGLHDNSHPEDIKTVLQMSKKTFKKAVGLLYKNKQIRIEPNGIYIIEEN